MHRLLKIALFCGLAWLSACEAPERSAPVLVVDDMARAQRLLSKAELASGDEARGLRQQAASQFEQFWRRTGQVAAAAQAISLWKNVRGGSAECAARLRAAAMAGELSGSLSQVVEQATTLRELPGCRVAAQQVLDSLPLSALRVVQEQKPVALQPRVETSAGAATLLRVERYGSKDSARIVVFLSSPAEYEVGVLPRQAARGPRLYVDIRKAQYGGIRQFEVGGLVNRVRLAENEKGVRIAFDLREAAREHIFYLPEPFRLVIDLSRASRGRPVDASGVLRRIVLDPGHGGHDPGAIGSSGLQEKDVALDIAHRAAPLIARELGITTMLTRDGDEYVPLDERVAKANAFGAELFVSVHCNASESPESHGVMTFVLDSARDALGKQTAARENAASEEAAQQFAMAMSRVMDAEVVSHSERFALLLQRASMASLGGHYDGLYDGGVRRAGFYVLAGAQMPAVLFEASFISNPDEEARLDSPHYRQKLADALVNAVRAFQLGPDL